ncbi:MAG: zinc ABC transporter substrate-binding protein [Bacteroidales bacterium]|nr:zinc ABC transporter substrate-binding protein [Bacteroidales bacterium]
MEEFINTWGYLGLTFGSFVAGSVLPFSSEALVLACYALGMDPVLTILFAMIGNVSGGMTCYYMGFLGKPKWVQKVFKLSDEKIEKTKRFISGRGAWMAFFAFVPFLGSAITVTLGLMRSNSLIVLVSMSIGKLIRYVVLVLGAWGIVSLIPDRPIPTSTSPTVTVSIEPLRYFVENIAGNHFKVVSFVPEGTSPETYDPTPQQMVGLGKSKAFFRIGYVGFEQTWMDRIVSNVPNLPIFDMSSHIDLIHGHHHHADDEDDEDSHVDPHVWSSVTNGIIIAGNVCDALCELDSIHKTEYTTRRDSLTNVIRQVGRHIRTALKDKGKTFLIYHPALSYFARDYDLKQISIEKEGKEPSPAYLQELITICRQRGVKVIFVQKEFDVRHAQLIADELQLQLIPINPLDYHWPDELMKTANALQ